MSKIIEGVRLDEERALYGSKNLMLYGVSFDGPADGESAVKECKNIEAHDVYCNLRYPFWHVKGLKIFNSEMTANCRAALWYSQNVEIASSKLHGIKAVRECDGVNIVNSSIVSPEFGWNSKNVAVKDSVAESEYFFLNAKNVRLEGVKFSGKYSFQYVEGGSIENCTLKTKDAFWHSKNLTVTNSVVEGEYLGWYSKNLTFVNCLIKGTQPLCYCKGLRLIGCRTEGCDLAFEKSEGEIELTSPIDSVKNFYSGKLSAPAVGQVIIDDKRAKGQIVAP